MFLVPFVTMVYNGVQRQKLPEHASYIKGKGGAYAEDTCLHYRVLL